MWPYLRYRPPKVHNNPLYRFHVRLRFLAFRGIGRNHLVRAITLASPLSCMVDREVRSDKIAENISDKKDKISFYLTSDILMRTIANCPFRGGEDRDVRRTQRPKARMPLGRPNDIFSRLLRERVIMLYGPVCAFKFQK